MTCKNPGCLISPLSTCFSVVILRFAPFIFVCHSCCDEMSHAPTLKVNCAEQTWRLGGMPNACFHLEMEECWEIKNILAVLEIIAETSGVILILRAPDSSS